MNSQASSLHIAILKNEDKASATKWSIACNNLGIKYQVIDLTKSDWLDRISSEDFDLFLLKPPGRIELYKQLYDERIFILSKILEKKIYPSFHESYIYENKKLLSYFLESRGIPHPTTTVFYDSEGAQKHLQQISFPIVAKTSIGASGSGVEILKDAKAGNAYVKRAFSRKGIKRRFGPNRVTGTPQKWLRKSISNPRFLLQKIREYISIYRDGQRGYLIFQENIPHEFEWRAVRIGESYFAHKKVKFKDKASGSKAIDYVNPPCQLLDFVKGICEENDLQCVAIDIFEHPSRGYLVNEIQTIFGHVQDHILEVDGIPGRYTYKNQNWVFEEGDFNTNESYNLRLKSALRYFNLMDE